MTLTTSQQKVLGILVQLALKEIRLLCWDNNGGQAADLADVVCAIPNQMFQPNFAWELHRQNLSDYQQRYRTKVDYVSLLCRAQSLIDAQEVL